jgi:undecaprenyl-diphosphatase
VTRLSVSSFTLLLCALGLFFAATFLFGGPEARFDRSLLVLAQIDGLVPAARLVTRLGDWWAFLLAGMLCAGWLAWRGRGREALLLAALLLSERLLVTGLKLAFGRSRPDPAGHLDAVHTMAFPSGHAANAMTLGLALALLLPPRGANRAPALLAGLLFAFLVGATRPVLGVHWPSDVAGGWALGALWTLLLLRLAAGTSASHQH